jgi:hypothetical protein
MRTKCRWDRLPVISRNELEVDFSSNFVPLTVIALATNSVQYELNAHPPPPRIFYQSDEENSEQLMSFVERTKQYYSSTNGLKRLIIPELIQLIKTKVSIAGEFLQVGGSITMSFY